MKSYNTLTQRGKARRLRQLAQTALADYDLVVRNISLVSNEQNGIFRIDTHDKQKYILRVVLPDGGHDAAHITSEMIFLDKLSSFPDLNAPIPMKTKTGKWYTQANANGVPQSRYCVIYSWVNGVDLADRRRIDTWQQFGELSARLHDIANGLQMPRSFKILTYDSIFPFAEPCVMDKPDNRKHFTDEQWDTLQLAMSHIQSDIDTLYADKKGLRVTHGDLHQWNVRKYYNTLSPIDFEDLMWAYPVQDIATTLYYNRFADNWAELFAAFEAGYSRVLPFPDWDAIETNMLARRIGLLNYIFAAEEESIEDYPTFIPLTMQRIGWVKTHVWDRC